MLSRGIYMYTYTRNATKCAAQAYATYYIYDVRGKTQSVRTMLLIVVVRRYLYNNVIISIASRPLSSIDQGRRRRAILRRIIFRLARAS